MAPEGIRIEDAAAPCEKPLAVLFRGQASGHPSPPLANKFPVFKLLDDGMRIALNERRKVETADGAARPVSLGGTP